MLITLFFSSCGQAVKKGKRSGGGSGYTMSCENAGMFACTGYRLKTPGTFSCSDMYMVSVPQCPRANCVGGCMYTDPAGNIVSTFFYADRYSRSAVDAMCANGAGTFTPCN